MWRCTACGRRHDAPPADGCRCGSETGRSGGRLDERLLAVRGAFVGESPAITGDGPLVRLAFRVVVALAALCCLALAVALLV